MLLDLFEKELIFLVVFIFICLIETANLSLLVTET